MLIIKLKTMNINKLITLQHEFYTLHGCIYLIISKLLYRYIRVRYQCDIPYTCELSNVHLCHQGFGIVITPNAKIGDNTYI